MPAGVIEVHGTFERGDAVDIYDRTGMERARGLIAYDSESASLIAGRKTGEIERMLGYRGRDELIHRDDLVLLQTWVAGA